MLTVLLLVLAAEPPHLVVQNGHRRDIAAIAVDPTGRFLFSAADGDTVQWDLTSGRILRTLEDGGTTSSELVVSRDGQTLYAVGFGEGVTVRRTSDGTLIKRLPGARHLALTADESTAIVGGGSSRVLRRVTTATGKVDFVIEAPDDVAAVSIAPDGSSFSATTKNRAHIYDGRSGALLRTIESSQRYGCGNLYLSNETLLLGGNNDGGSEVEAFDVKSGRRRWAVRPGGASCDPVMSRDGRTVYVPTQGKTVGVIDVAAGKMKPPIEVGHEVRRVVLHPSKPLLFTITGSNLSEQTLREISLASGTEARKWENASAGISGAYFLRDEPVLAVLGNDHTLRSFDLRTGMMRHMGKAGDGLVTATAHSEDGRVAVISANETTVVMDVVAGQVLEEIKHEPKKDGFLNRANVWRVDRASDGDVVMSADVTTNDVRLVNGGTTRWHYADDTFGPTSVMALGRGRAAITTGAGLWFVSETGERSLVLKGKARGLDRVPGVHGRNQIAVGLEPNTLAIVDVDTRAVVRTIPNVRGAVFSGDGKRIASMVKTSGDSGYKSRDNTIAILDAATGKELRRFDTHEQTSEELSFSADGRWLSVSTPIDVRIHDLERGGIVAYVMPLRGQDWVVSAPDGRFDGSNDGVKQVHWVQGNDALSIDAFFERLYVPRLLAQLWAPAPAGLPVVAPQASAIDLRHDLRLPPVVTIVSPASGDSFKKELVEVHIEVQERGAGVDELRLFHNGKLVGGDERGFKRTAAKQTHVVKLVLLPGRNELRALALSTDRIESEPSSVEVTFEGGSSPSDLHLLIVGINDYKNAVLSLNYGKPDAQAFVKLMEQRGKKLFNRIHKVELYDGKATRPAILAALADLKRNAKPDDVFIFYFAGHGVMSDADGAVAAQYHLIPHEATRLYGDAELLRTQALAVDELKQIARDIPARKQVMILDACQSGGAVEAFAQRGALEQKAIYQLARSAGVVVLAAAGTEQMATEFKALSHGVFTYALLAALNGAADKGGDGKITIREIDAYLNDAVPELTKKHRGSAQFPNSYVVGQDFPIGLSR